MAWYRLRQKRFLPLSEPTLAVVADGSVGRLRSFRQIFGRMPKIHQRPASLVKRIRLHMVPQPPTPVHNHNLPARSGELWKGRRYFRFQGRLEIRKLLLGHPGHIPAREPLWSLFVLLGETIQAHAAHHGILIGGRRFLRRIPAGPVTLSAPLLPFFIHEKVHAIQAHNHCMGLFGNLFLPPDLRQNSGTMLFPNSPKPFVGVQHRRTRGG